MAIKIKQESTDFYKRSGFQYGDNMVDAFDEERQLSGVVNIETNEFFPTVPLNGWRCRNLAEEVFGRREASQIYVNRIFVTTAEVLQNLPGFDDDNQAIVDSYQGAVAVHVAKVDPSYGAHIRIMQM